MRREWYRICALVSASVLLSVVATVGWSQGIIWLGTLGGPPDTGDGHASALSFVFPRIFCCIRRFVDGSIIVGATGSTAFRWTPDGGMEDLSQTYAGLIGGHLHAARAITPDGRYIVGWGYNQATGRTQEAYLLHDPRCENSGDVDNNGCIDDADLLTVLFAFGSIGSLGRVDVNCDGTVDDADLLIVLFNFGSGCCAGARGGAPPHPVFSMCAGYRARRYTWLR